MWRIDSIKTEGVRRGLYDIDGLNKYSWEICRQKREFDTWGINLNKDHVFHSSCFVND